MALYVMFGFILDGIVAATLLWVGFTIVGGVAATVAAVHLVFFAYLMKRPPGPFRGRARWRLDSYDDYDGRVPDNVRRLATELRARVPGVTLKIDGLWQRETNLDPFLVADGHYVAVWDEPEFDN